MHPGKRSFLAAITLASVELATVPAARTTVAAVQVADAPAAPQTPVFRASVDLIAVDVQVVARDGTPIPGLAADDFTVTIDGHARRVISADYVQSAAIDGRPFIANRAVGPTASNVWPDSTAAPTGRLYILAFDTTSLSIEDARAVVSSARTFIDRLLPNDRVGLYVFFGPTGRFTRPSTNHGGVRRALDWVTGSTTYGLNNTYHLSMSEVVDITAEALGGIRYVTNEVMARECEIEPQWVCLNSLRSEAQALAFDLESRATEALKGLRTLVDILGDIPGRKTTVFFSSGIPTSDRAGGRPDVGDLPAMLGRDAAATNTSIYVVYVDSSHFRAMGAETRAPMVSPSTSSRDYAVGSRIMQHFTSASGGAFIPVLAGAGEFALERVLRETLSHYLLGVQPEPEDRDGTLQPLRVEVARNDVTIRSRMWVVVPKSPTPAP
jgi:VWFA-related protein